MKQKLNVRKLYLLPVLVLALLTSCSKEEPHSANTDKNLINGATNNSGTLKQHVFGKEMVWTKTKTYPLSQNHHHHVSNIMEIGDKMYVIRTYNTGYQSTRTLCLLNGAEFVKIRDYSAYPPVYTQDYILTAAAVYTKKTGVSTITTDYFDVKSEQSTIYEQEHTDLESPASLTYLVQSENELYLITKYNLDDPAYLWKWDNVAKKWNKILDRIPDSENWTVTVGWAKGLHGEFILQTQNRNITAPEENYYVFRDNKLQLLYKRTGQEHYMGADGARVIAFDNKYLLVEDESIKEITGTTTTKPYKEDMVSGKILAVQVYGDFLFMVEGSLQLYVPIVDKCKTYHHKTNTLYTFHGLPIGPEQPGAWHFKPSDKGLDIILNKNVGVYINGGGMAFDTYLYSSAFDWNKL